MRNTLEDLNNHLFEQLERLNDEDLKDEELTKEINRAKAMSGIANQIVSNASVVLKAKIAYDEHIDADARKPKMLEG